MVSMSILDIHYLADMVILFKKNNKRCDIMIFNLNMVLKMYLKYDKY